MNSIANLRGQSIDRAPAGLNERLVWLTRFGKPRVGVYGSDGLWHACIEMHVADAVKGAKFEVKSDFTCPSPEAAIEQLVPRMLGALSKLGAA